METWVIERLKPFHYIGTATNGKQYLNSGSEKDSAFFSVPETAAPDEVAEIIWDMHPFMVPKPNFGFVKQKRSDGSEFFRYVNVNKEDFATVFYKWPGSTLFTANKPHFDLIGV